MCINYTSIKQKKKKFSPLKMILRAYSKLETFVEEDVLDHGNNRIGSI